MASERLVRVNQLIRHEIAEQIFRVVNEPDFDHAAVTVTRVVTSPDLRTSRIMVSVLGDDHKKKRTLSLLHHHRRDLQGMVARHIKLKYTPIIHFELDESIATGDQVLHLISDLESEHPEWRDESSHGIHSADDEKI